MANPTQERQIKDLADFLNNEILPKIYGKKMGFLLLITDFNTVGLADYVANGKREDCIEWMRETVERFEKMEFIPATQGNA